MREPWAYFASAAPDLLRGDDWDDAPYEHNAGTPYSWYPKSGVAPYSLVKVAYDGDDLVPPTARYQATPWTVFDINRNKIVPWLAETSVWTLVSNSDYAVPACIHQGLDLSGDPVLAIFAGATLEEFIIKVHRAKGHVYTDALPGRIGGLRLGVEAETDR